MNINVPEFVREHFWEEPQKGMWEFWAFRFPPKCKVGDELIFRIDGKPVAKAICCLIEKPGVSICEQTGKYKNRWKVYWKPESFIDLRNK